MNFSINNLSGTNANISNMISQIVAKKSNSLNSLIEQKTSIENTLAALRNGSFGGSVNSSYSSQISSLQDTIDRLKEQYTVNENKLSTINSLKNSYKKAVTTLDDYINSLKNPNDTDVTLSATSSNSTVAGVTLTGSANPQKIDLTVSQMATCSTLTSSKIQGSSITADTKITDLFSGSYNATTNTITSTRKDLSGDMKLSSLGITSGAFKLGARVIRVSEDDTLDDLIAKINSDANYTAQIDSTTHSFTITATTGNSVAITNAVGDLSVGGDISTTTLLSDIGVKAGTYFVGDYQLDVEETDTVGTLIDKIETLGYRAELITDVNNPSAKVLSITDDGGNAVLTNATNFTSMAGFTVSEGTFKINDHEFTIESDTTIEDLVFEINKATADGVGATFKDGKIVLTASKTGAIDIKVDKGTSNFTNAVGFTQGGTMNTANYVLGTDGSYATLRGLNTNILSTDVAKADGSGQFKTGSFSISYSKLDANGAPTNNLLTTQITIEDGDTIETIIEKIKTQTTQTWTDSNGVEHSNYLQAEIVGGQFQIRQIAKGDGYQISVVQGTSDFTNYVGLTANVNHGTATLGSSTTFTGINAVTNATTFSEGSFSITASKANDPTTTETVTIDVTEGETLESVIEKINASGLAVTAQLVDIGDGTQRLQLAHNNYGSGYTISVASGSSDFTQKVGFTASVVVGESNTSTNSTLTGVVSGLDSATTGYTDGSFVIKTNKLNSDGSGASSEMASAVIEVTSSMSLQDIMNAIGSATYKDAEGNDVDLGLRASLTADGKIQITQVNSGEGFDIEVEAGDTNFTQEVGLTGSVSIGGVTQGSTSTSITGGIAYDGTFTEGSFKVTTNVANPDGSASDEMVSKDITIQAGKTLEEQLDDINTQLAEIGLKGSIVDGKLKIEQLNGGEGYDIQIEAGSTDFTEKLGFTTSVTTGVSSEGSFAYLKAGTDWSSINFGAITTGEFTVSTNVVDANGNPTSEMQSVNVQITAGQTADEILASINSQVSSIGLSASIVDGKLTLTQQNSGEGFTIKVESGTTNFTALGGLAAPASVSVSTTATSTKLTGATVVNQSAIEGTDFTSGSFKITVGRPDGTTTTETITVSSGDTLSDVASKITSNANLGVNAYVDDNGNFVIEHNNAGSGYTISVEAGNTTFTEYAGLTQTVTIGESNEGTSATLTGQTSGLTTSDTFSEGSFIITTNGVLNNAADPNNILSITIDVEENETMESILEEINTKGASIGITAELTGDGKIQLKQTNAGAGFDISVVAGGTDFTERVGLTSEVIEGTSTQGTKATLTGENYIGTDFYSTKINGTNRINPFAVAGNHFCKNASGGQLAILVDGSKFVTLDYSAGQNINTILSNISEALEYGLGYENVNVRIEANSVTVTYGNNPENAQPEILIEDVTGDFAQYTGLNKLHKTAEELEAIHSDYHLYAVSDVGELMDALSNANTDPLARIVLLNDIDMIGVPYQTISSFNGVLDGNGYAIKNLNLSIVNNSSDGVVAMFGELTGTVKNLAFENVYIDAGGAYSVSVLANNMTGATVDNIRMCNINGTYVSTAHFGLLAANATNSNINNIEICNSSIYMENCVNGGLLFGSINNTSLSNFTIFGTTVDCTHYNEPAVGTIIGTVTDSTVSKGYLESDVSFTASAIATATNSTVTDIYYNITFHAFSDVGTNTSSTVDVTASDDSNAATIKNNIYSTGNFYTNAGRFMIRSFSTAANDKTSLVEVPQFTTGTFTITAGESGSEVTATITIDANDTKASVIEKINSAGLGITAEVNDDGKFVLTADDSGPNFNISVESGTSDFLEYVGLATTTESIGELQNGTKEVQFSTLTGTKDVTASTAITTGSFKINGVTIDITGTTISSAINAINVKSAETGVKATVVDNKLTLTATTTGNQTIYVEGGTSNFGEVTGLTTTTTQGGVALGTEATMTTVTGTKVVKSQYLTEEEAIAQGYTVIKTAEDLRKIYLNTGSYILMNDIDLSSYDNFQIGNASYRFAGTLDGNGHTISGLTSNKGGLFAILGGTVKNLTLDGFDITKSSDKVGILANTASVGDIIIDNVNITNSSLTTTGDYVGGLIGHTAYTSTSDLTITNVDISNVRFDVAGASAGALVGVACVKDLNISGANINNVVFESAGNGSLFAGMVAQTMGIRSNITDSYVNCRVENSPNAVLSGITARIQQNTKSTDTNAIANISNIYVSTNGQYIVNSQIRNSDLTCSQIFYTDENLNSAADGTHQQVSAGDYSGYVYCLDSSLFDKQASQKLSNTEPVNEGLTQISAGTVNINGTSITLTAGDINSAIEQINAHSATTGVFAKIVDGKVQFSSLSGFTIAEGTSDFVEKTGTAGYVLQKYTSENVYDCIKFPYSTNRIDSAMASKLGYTQVSNYDELMSALSQNQNIVLVNDIDFTGCTDYLDVNNYSKVLNGNGYKILNYDSDSALIDSASAGAVIKNLEIVDSNVTFNTAGNHALLVADANGSITFENIKIDGGGVQDNTDGSTASNMGILLGHSYMQNGGGITFDNIEIMNVVNDASCASVGHLAGNVYAAAYVDIKNITIDSSNISGDQNANAGSLIGFVSASNVVVDNAMVLQDFYVEESSNGLNDGRFAGYIGKATNMSDLVIKNSYVSSTVFENYDIQDPSEYVNVDGVGVSVTYENCYHAGSQAITGSTANSVYEDVDVAGASYYEGAYKTRMSQAEAEALGYTCISTVEDFKSLISSNLSGKFMLMNNLDWDTIAAPTITNFSGTLDGNGYTISGLSSGTGSLFDSTADGAVIRNLNIANFNTAGGALVARAVDSITIENVNVYDSNISTIQAGSYYVGGGLIGYSTSAGSSSEHNYVIIDNVNTKNVNVNAQYSGGLIGYINVYPSTGYNNRTLIKNTNINGTLQGDYVGGVVAKNVSSSIVIDNVNTSVTIGGTYTNGGIIAESGGLPTRIYNSFINTSGCDTLVGSYTGSDISYYGVIANSNYTKSYNQVAYSCSSTAYFEKINETKISHEVYKTLVAGTLSLASVSYYTNIAVKDYWTIDDLANAVNNANIGAQMVCDGEHYTITGISSFNYGSVKLAESLNDPHQVLNHLKSKNRYVSRVSGLTMDSTIDGLTSGSFILGSTNFAINSDDTVGDIIEKINAQGTYKAGLDSDGSFYIDSETAMNTVLSFNQGTSNFDSLLFFDTTFENTATTTTQSALVGCENLTGNETLQAGSFNLYVGNRYETITVNEGETVNTVLSRINESSVGVSAQILNGKLVLVSDDLVDSDNIALKELSGNFGTITGTTTITPNAGVSVVGHDGSYTTLTGSKEIKVGMTVAEAVSQGYTIIDSEDDLAQLSGSTGKFFLANDITITSMATIGLNFSGELNGNGHTISTSVSTPIGLFSTLSGDSVTIKNLTLSGFNINSTNQYSGILAAQSTATTLNIENVAIKNSTLNNTRGTSGTYVAAMIANSTSKFVKVNNVLIDSDVLINTGTLTPVGGLFYKAVSSVSGSTFEARNVDLKFVYDSARNSAVRAALAVTVNAKSSILIENVYSAIDNKEEGGSGAFGLVYSTTSSSGTTVTYSNIYIDTRNNVRSDRLLTTNNAFQSAIDNVSNYNIISDTAIDRVNSLSVNEFEAVAHSFYTNPYTQVTAGTLKVNGTTITLSDGSVQDAVDTINTYSAQTGVTAQIENNKVVFKNTEMNKNGITIAEGTSNFVQVTGTAGYTIVAPTKTTLAGTITGTNAVQSTQYTQAEAEAMGYTWIDSVDSFYSAITNNSNGKFMLGCDLDFSSLGTLTEKKLSEFNGEFNGNGYTLSNYSSQFSLFGDSMSGATIKNVHIDSFSVAGGGDSIGALLGYAQGAFTFENITIKDTTVGAGEVFGQGLLVGEVYYDSADASDHVIFDNIKISDSGVNGATSIGGLAGVIYTDSNVIVNNVEISGLDMNSDVTLNCAGSLIGELWANTIVSNTNVYGGSNGATYQYSGGMIGYFNTEHVASTRTVNLSFTNTYVSVDQSAGGTGAQYVGIVDGDSTAVRHTNAYYDSTKTTGATESGTSTTSDYATLFNKSAYTDWTAKAVAKTASQAIADGYTCIYTADEFVTQIKANLNGKFMLMNDLDFSGVTSIGTGITGFGGVLDGNGYTIKNFTSTTGGALFNTVATGTNAEFRNMTLENFNVSGGTYSAPLIARAQGNVEVDNITVKSSTISTSETVTTGVASGLISYASSFVLNINNVNIESTVNVTSGTGTTAMAAGIVGYNISANGFTSIKNSSSAANIVTTGMAGQVIGRTTADALIIDNVRTAGSISSKYIGAVIGYLSDTAGTDVGLSVKNVYSSTKLTPAASTTDTQKGAVVGYGANTITFKDCLFVDSTLTDAGITTLPDGVTTTGTSDFNTRANARTFYEDIYQQVHNSTITINGHTFGINAGSIQSAISQINSKSDITGVVAYIDEEQKVKFESTTNSGIKIQEGAGDFYDIAVSNVMTSSTFNDYILTSSKTGLTLDTTLGELTGDRWLDGRAILVGKGFLTIYDIDANTTVGDIIDEITIRGGVAGLDENGSFFVKMYESAQFTNKQVISDALGLSEKTYENSAVVDLGEEAEISSITGTKTITADTEVSAGDFVINYAGDSTKYTVTDGMTMQDVVAMINRDDPNLSVEILNGKIYMYDVNGMHDRITITNGTSNFTELAGFTYGAEQAVDTVAGKNAVLLSQNTALSVQGQYTTGTFLIYKTNEYGNKLVNPATITIEEGDTIANIIQKINASGLNVNAYIDDATGKLAIERGDSSLAGGLVVEKGTSNFTNLIGLTSGGEQSAEMVAGSTAELVSQNVVTNASFSDGTFSIDILDVDGNVTSTHEFTVSSSDSATKIAEDITNAGIGLTAFIDNETNKMVIRKNADSEEGSFVINKGTSDFTTVLNFTSGGHEIGTLEQGSTAKLTSMNSADSVTGLTAGTFVVNGTEVTITDSDLVSADPVQAILDKINANTNVVASLDANNRIVLTRKAEAGEGEIVVEKGSSNFTTKFGFTSGGGSTATLTSGTDAVLRSGTTTLDTVVGEGNFFVSITGENASASPMEIVVTAGSTVQTVIGQINALDGVSAKFDSSTGQVVIEKDDNYGDGTVKLTSGSSNFMTLLGFDMTTGGLVEGTDPVYTAQGSTIDPTNSTSVVTDGSLTVNGNTIDATGKTLDQIVSDFNALNLAGITASIVDDKFTITSVGDVEPTISATGNFATITGMDSATINYVAGSGDFTVSPPTFVGGSNAHLSSAQGLNKTTEISAGDFIINVTNSDGSITKNTITVEDGDTIETVIGKIDALDGLSATWNSATGSFDISLDSNSGATSFEVVKGTSDFTNITGITVGGQQIVNKVDGTNSSISSTVDADTTFSEGDFVINLTGNNAGQIVIDVDEGDTIEDIVNKINDKNAGVVADYDASTGKITITRDESIGDGGIEIGKGSSNFTTLTGFTTGGGSSSATFVEGTDAKIVSTYAAGPNQTFTEGNFFIELTGENATRLTIDVAAGDHITDVARKINELQAGVFAYVDDSNKLVIERDADMGIGSINVIGGSSSITRDLGFTSGGDYTATLEQGYTSKIVSTLDHNTVGSSYTAGNFYIQLTDKDGNNTGSPIEVIINSTNGVVDDIYTVISNINAQNAGVTASLNSDGKLVIQRDQTTSAGGLAIIKGTSDFTNKFGFTTGGGAVDGTYIEGAGSTRTMLSSQDLGSKLVSDSMTLGSIGVQAGLFKINGVDITVKTSDTIYDLASRINSVFSAEEYADIRVSASYENGELVIRTQNAGTTITVERGTSNFTDIANLTNAYQNSEDLGITDLGHNAHFNINGTDYDMALDLNENGENMLYLDENGNVVTDPNDSAIEINIIKTGNTVIEVGRAVLDDSVKKLQTFINRFNSAMNASTNSIMADDTSFTTFINKIRKALTSDVGDLDKITSQLADIGIVIKVAGGSDSSMGIIQMSLTKTNGKYDYVEAFYKDPQHVMDLLIGDDSEPIDHSVAGVFTRLSDVLHTALEDNRNGYFKVTPRSIEAQQKALKSEITSLTFDLNELKNQATGGGDGAMSEYLSQLEAQYQLINKAIADLNKQYNSSLVRLILNQNNASFNPIVS